jgi:hypothetical protein
MPDFDKWGQKVPYPTLDDAPNIETATRDLVNAAVANGVLHFADANARAATLIGDSAPFDGMLTWLNDVKRMEVYNSDTWQPYSTIPTWTDYTATWAGLSVMGTSVSSARYLADGKRREVVATLTGGSGTSLGTGQITMTLPTPASNAVPSGFGWHGVGRFSQNDGTAWRLLSPVVEKGASAVNVYAVRTSDNGLVSPGTAGYTWVAGCSMRIHFAYETA